MVDPKMKLVKSHTDKTGKVRYVWKFEHPKDNRWKSTGVMDNPKTRRSEWKANREVGRRLREYKPSEEKTIEEYVEPFYGPNCPYLDELRDDDQEPSAAHCRKYRLYLHTYILNDPIAHVLMIDMKKTDLKSFRKRLIEKLGSKTRTVNGVIAAFRVVIGFANEEGVTRIPARALKKVQHKRQSHGAFSEPVCSK